MAARAVIKAKQTHPGIMLRRLLPYYPADRMVDMQPGFDGTYYPPGMERAPYRLAILLANRHMVDSVDYLIAYAWHPASNARELVRYGQRRNIVVTNLAVI